MNIRDGQDFMEVLDEITNKRPNQLDNDEIGFLRARRYYLTPGQIDKFAQFLKDVDVPTPSERPKVKRAKKSI